MRADDDSQMKNRGNDRKRLVGELPDSYSEGNVG
jgi:hypothetical protein